MISRLKGKLVKKEENRIILEVGGVFYEINIPRSVYPNIKTDGYYTELVIYHYFNLEKSRSIPIMIGFSDELEKEFFEKFISVAGIGPKAALKALDKPLPLIARAIEEGDVDFLKTLEGIGKQKARQIIAHLQGKVGRFVLLRREEVKEKIVKKEIVEEARKILRRLQYNSREIESMIKKALGAKSEVETVEEFLNEIYRQWRKVI